MTKHPTQLTKGAWLVIDGSSASTFVGVLEISESACKWLAYSRSGAAPLESLFPSVEDILKKSRLGFEAIHGYLYSEGPGSVLGLRLCAMAIQTWAKLYPQTAHFYGFNSLQLAAANLLNTENPSQALIVSDWKRTAWNSVRISDGCLGPCTPISSEKLEQYSGPLYHLPARKGWQAPPEKAQGIQDHPEKLHELIHFQGLLKPCDDVQLYTSGTNLFQKWTPERHRGKVTS